MRVCVCARARGTSQDEKKEEQKQIVKKMNKRKIKMSGCRRDIVGQ